MIFIDPSELRQTSNLKQYISDIHYKSLSGLEASTGADLMVSPDGLPVPRDYKMLRYHIKQGAKLIQVKFGHDVASSVIDGRLNEALSRMLKTDAMSWQCILLFVGIFSYDDTKGMALINNQLSYTDPPMKWKSIQAALTFWTERGGSLDFPLSSGKLIQAHLAIHQNHINRFRSGEDTKLIWPSKPVFYDEIDSDPLREWRPAQKTKLVEGIEVLLCAIPDAKIGPGKAMAAVEYMIENNIPAHFGGFLELLNSKPPRLLEIPGYGKGTLNAILRGLWHTKKQREANK